MHSKAIVAVLALAALSSFTIAMPLPWDGGNAYTGAAGNAAGGIPTTQDTADAGNGLGVLNLFDPTSDSSDGVLGTAGLGSLGGAAPGGDGGQAVSGDAVGGSGGYRCELNMCSWTDLASGLYADRSGCYSPFFRHGSCNAGGEGGSGGGSAYSGVGGNTAGGGASGSGFLGMMNLFGSECFPYDLSPFQESVGSWPLTPFHRRHLR